MSQRRNYYHAGRHPQHDRCDKCHKDYEFCNCVEYYEDYDDSCDRCHKSYEFCSCKKKHHDEGALVEKVICSKEVQKKAEFLLPAAVGPLPLDLITGLLGSLVNVTVTPNFNGIKQEVTVIKDQVINFGYIPATLSIVGPTLPILDLANIPIRIFFQEHTDCPGACPGDQVIETAPVVDAILNEPLIGNGPDGGFVNLLLFKAVLRTHITVVRQGIKRNGKICDLDSRRCEPTGTPTVINSPLNLTPNTTSGTTGAATPASNTGNTNTNG